MLYLKLIIAVLLSLVPFIYEAYVRPKQNTSPEWRNAFTALGTHLPRLKAVKDALMNTLHNLYQGMKKSDNFRKFFTLIIMLIMIAIQFVDFSVSTSIADIINDTSRDTEKTSSLVNIYGPLMTRPTATILAFAITLTMFSYSIADCLLTALHNHKKFFVFTANIVLLILLSSPRYFVVAEVLAILLIAALIYPNKIINDDPQKKKPIPENEESYKLQRAA